MEAFVVLILGVMLLWGAWGLVKFVFSNFAAIFWTTLFFVVLFGFYLIETAN